MSQREVRIGIVGVGQIGKNHLRRYQDIEGVRIVAVADINEDEAKRVAHEFGADHVYTDFRKLLARDDVEAVDVCLHNNLHRPVTVAALKAGKHVYTEKPMAGSYVDALAMRDTARERGLMLHVQLKNLYDPETRVARFLIDEGKLGSVYHARSTGFRRRGRPFVDGYGTSAFVQKETAQGGALYDMGVYHITQLLYLMDNPRVERVSGKTYQRTPMDEERRRSSGYNVEELGLGFVRFADDVTMDIIEAWAIHLDGFEGSSVVGDLGGVRLNPFGYFTSVGDVNLDAAVSLDAYVGRLKLMNRDNGAYASSQAHWVHALRGDVELLPTAELALNTMLISEAIYLSEELGREVTAEEAQEKSESTAVKL